MEWQIVTKDMVQDELEEIEKKTKSKMSMWATEYLQECIPKPLAVQFEHLMTTNESKTKNERQLNIQFLAQSCLRLHTDLFSAGKQLAQFKSIGQVTQLVVSAQLKQLNQVFFMLFVFFLNLMSNTSRPTTRYLL